MVVRCEEKTFDVELLCAKKKRDLRKHRLSLTFFLPADPECVYSSCLCGVAFDRHLPLSAARIRGTISHSKARRANPVNPNSFLLAADPTDYGAIVSSRDCIPAIIFGFVA